MRFDAFELMKCFRGDITLTTIGATDDRHVLDHEQIGTLPVASSDVTDFRSTPAACIARERRGLSAISHIA